MRKSKLVMVFLLGITICLIGLPGCGGKKKSPEEQKRAAAETKAPEKKPTPKPIVKEPPRRAEEDLRAPRDLKFTTIYFDFDKSNIRVDQRRLIESNAQLLSKYKTLKVRIEGHCDERGTNGYNLALGQRRADAIKRYLIDYGISSSNITTLSYGEERPVDSGHNETAWGKNRRGEFVITAR